MRGSAAQTVHGAWRAAQAPASSRLTIGKGETRSASRPPVFAFSASLTRSYLTRFAACVKWIIKAKVGCAPSPSAKRCALNAINENQVRADCGDPRDRSVHALEQPGFPHRDA